MTTTIARLAITPNAEAMIEHAARICYQSLDRGPSVGATLSKT